MKIRRERQRDYRTVEEITREAFWNHNSPGCMEHYLLHEMRAHPDFIPELSLVAEEGEKLAGHIAYTHAKIAGAEGQEWPILCFGPLSVHPDTQGKGVGTALVLHSLELARDMGHTAVCITGNPKFYGQLGFRAAERYDIRYANEKFMPALLAIELIPGALAGKPGRFTESPVFEVDMAGFDAFDATFPHKEKVRGTKSQNEFKVLSGIMYG